MFQLVKITEILHQAMYVEEKSVNDGNQFVNSAGRIETRKYELHCFILVFFPYFRFLLVGAP